MISGALFIVDTASVKRSDFDAYYQFDLSNVSECNHNNKTLSLLVRWEMLISVLTANRKLSSTRIANIRIHCGLYYLYRNTFAIFLFYEFEKKINPWEGFYAYFQRKCHDLTENWRLKAIFSAHIWQRRDPMREDSSRPSLRRFVTRSGTTPVLWRSSFFNPLGLKQGSLRPSVRGGLLNVT